MKKTGFVRILTVAFALIVGAACVTFEIPMIYAETQTETHTGGVFERYFAGEEGEVLLLFTHDIHSHMEPFTVVDDEGNPRSVGGMARMKTAIDERRGLYETSFLLDAGDFSMGTLYQVLYSSHASELVTMGKMGYDATCFGNHEFDFGLSKAAQMFESAQREAAASDVTMPHFTATNIDWTASMGEDARALKSAMDDYGAGEYFIIERNGIKLGVFGLQGEESVEDAPLATLEFMNIVDAAKAAVSKLQEEGCDMIVALSHSGTRENDDESEDIVLAKNVPEIDFIVSGHTHRSMPEPIVVGKTVIGSVGCYGQYLGQANLVPDGNGRWELKNYELIEMNADIEEDAGIKEILKSYRPLMDSEYLSQFGFSADSVIAHNNIAFTPLNKMEGFYRESNLGNIIADSYIYAVQTAEGDDYEPVAVALSPVGVIRDTISVGDVTAEDAFNISSLGIGADGIAGYPLIECYLTGEEIKTLAEVDVSVSQLMPPAQLYPSGAKWTYNPHRLILNRVMDVRLVDTSSGVPDADAYAGEGMPLEKDKLYRVVGGLYSMQMMSAVESKSYGLLKVQPKDESGVPIEDFNSCILYDRRGNEIKEWYALASYLASFEPGDDGISVIPDRYASVEGRKVGSDSRNPVELFGHPNMIGKALYAIVGIVLIMIIAIATIVKKLRRKKDRHR